MTETTKRYFYTDPLAACWMAKHFGMTFIGARELFEDERNVATVSVIHPGEVYELKSYVHPDSLALLNPLPNDLLYYGYGAFPHAGEAWDELRAILQPDDERYPVYGDGENYMLLDSGDLRPVWRLERIIQRDGKPFHWPEFEEA